LIEKIIETDSTGSKTINNAMDYSCPYQNPMYIIVNNKLKDKVSLYWVDTNGTERFYAELNPNGTSTACAGIGAFLR
jgi:hypothetical protein